MVSHPNGALSFPQCLLCFLRFTQLELHLTQIDWTLHSVRECEDVWAPRSWTYSGSLELDGLLTSVCGALCFVWPQKHATSEVIFASTVTHFIKQDIAYCGQTWPNLCRIHSVLWHSLTKRWYGLEPFYLRCGPRFCSLMDEYCVFTMLQFWASSSFVAGTHD